MKDNQMPKLIADVKTNDIEMTDNGVKLEDDKYKLSLRAEFNTNNSVSPQNIKSHYHLSVVRKRLLTILDRSLYHQLDHQQKVTIAKGNLIAGICTAAIHTGCCKDALALYRQSL
eukprot:26355_1